MIWRQIPPYSFPNQTLLFMCLQEMSFENTVGKGEIAHEEQFLLLPKCFLPFWRTLPFSSNLKLSSANSLSLEESKICCLGKGLNIVGKGEKTGNQHILLFPEYFQTHKAFKVKLSHLSPFEVDCKCFNLDLV